MMKNVNYQKISVMLIFVKDLLNFFVLHLFVKQNVKYYVDL